MIVLGGMYQKKSETVVGPRGCAFSRCISTKRLSALTAFRPKPAFGRDMMRADVVSAVLAKGVGEYRADGFQQIRPDPAQPRWRSRARSAG